jgi:ABC-type Zn uptake system ZnuABC Zn-binding protein ZnuA
MSLQARLLADPKPCIARIIRLCAIVCLLGAVLPVSACSPAAPPSGKPTVVATIFSYYDALRAIGGDDVHAVLLLPQGTSPHDFLPAAKDKGPVSEARLILKAGLGLDPWIDRLDNDNPNATVLDIGAGLEAIQTEEIALPGQQKEEESAAGNPHVWLDPLNQIKAAELIRGALIKIDPAHQAAYTQRAAAYVADLRQLDADFAAAAKTFKHKDFVGFHSAYAYLARRYGLRQVASIQELGAGGMNPAQIQKVIEIIKTDHVPVVFSETAFDAKQANIVVQATGVKLGTLQPLETYDDLQDTYVKLMRENLDQLARAMKD